MLPAAEVTGQSAKRTEFWYLGGRNFGVPQPGDTVRGGNDGSGHRSGSQRRLQPFCRFRIGGVQPHTGVVEHEGEFLST